MSLPLGSDFSAFSRDGRYTVGLSGRPKYLSPQHDSRHIHGHLPCQQRNRLRGRDLKR